ncbi:13272_t:CDS:1, partial [Funneliformis mosseae]
IFANYYYDIARTKKSYLISIIRDRLQENSIVLALIGVAVFNIQ